MLGSWSFGDYFKREAIVWAWELLTQKFGLPVEKLWVTVYHTDTESYDIWHQQVGVPIDRIMRIGDNKGAPMASDNFWQMADTGPCGPCTEIFYDHGAHIAGGPPGSPDADGDRYIEIWNIVFMQFDRAPDGTLSPLPTPCVDTGMGLERLAAVLQHVNSNYQIDLFVNLLAQAAALTAQDDFDNQSLRVIVDHIRACSFLIVDGVLPSNEGRGYVLRRIIRRALRHGWMIGVRGDFFWKMVAPLVAEMGTAYPELAARQGFVEDTLRDEEMRFGVTLEQGMRLFDDLVGKMGADKLISAADAFQLYDTYGFPLDLTADMARERGLEVDRDGFEKAMQMQRERARASGKFAARNQLPVTLINDLTPTQFLGYHALDAVNCKVLGMLREGCQVEQLTPGEQGDVILQHTPFYAESGGQIGDIGELSNSSGFFTVTDTLKKGDKFFVHVGCWHGEQSLKRGDVLHARVDGAHRQAVTMNHSATHLLHAALRQVLGVHVKQKGSHVSASRLRFDFTHSKPLHSEERLEVEALVNMQVRLNASAQVHHMSHEDAIAAGALELSGENYGNQVRVLEMGDFSMELCGGTHVERMGEIGLFKVVLETGVASGVRRIEAVTGSSALDFVVDEERRLGLFSALLSSSGEDALDKLRQLLDRQQKLERELVSLRKKMISRYCVELAASAQDIEGAKVVVVRLEDLDARSLRDLVDRLKQKLSDCVILLAGVDGGRVSLVAGVHGSALDHIKAGEVVAHMAQQIDGKGGGRADLAQGGGVDTPQLPDILLEVRRWISERLF